MISTEITPWSRLGDAERTAWRDFRQGRAEFESPFFDLGFMDAVARTRPDLQAAIVHDRNGGIEGILPFHHDGAGGLAPAAGPLSDWHGLLCAPQTPVDIGALLAAARAGALHFPNLPAVDPIAGERPLGARPSHIIDIGAGPAAYLAAQAKACPKAFRNLRARRRKAVDKFGQIRVEARDTSRSSLDWLISHKKSQYLSTGQIDVFGVSWTVNLLRDLAQGGEDGFGGQLSTLWFGDRIAAAHFGMRSGDVLHWWFPTYDPQLAEFSPGLLLLHGLIEQGDAPRQIDLGPGDYRFKKELANAQKTVVSAFHHRPTALGMARAGLIKSGQLLARANPSWGALPARAGRRAYLAWTLRAPARQLGATAHV